MKKNIVRIEAPGKSVSPTSTSDTPTASTQDAETEEFIPRPWVNVKPLFPWRPVVAGLAAIVLIVAAAVLIRLDADTSLDPQAEAALMAEAMPNLDRSGEPVSEEAVLLEDEEQVTVEDPLKILIVKVTETQIRANGKLVNLQDLGKLCENTENATTLKLINRRGDTRVIEAVIGVLDSNNLRYHYVNN